MWRWVTPLPSPRLPFHLRATARVARTIYDTVNLYANPCIVGTGLAPVLGRGGGRPGVERGGQLRLYFFPEEIRKDLFDGGFSNFGNVIGYSDRGLVKLQQFVKI